jgi:DNA-binding NarL/FixJ family response regulator
MSPERAIEYALEQQDCGDPPRSGDAGGLSPREVEVLRLVADGLTDAQVAQRLHISPRTVGQHLHSVYKKLGVPSRAAATRRAGELGLL